ncbi:MAG: polyhydroxyalkanoate synthesis repressor PhaR [Pseudomonadota bacterium]
MANPDEANVIQISRYSSRRLYNTKTSDYITVDEIAELVREGYNVKITDKKSGEDITSQILIQIIADQEAKGGSVLPVNVLTDIVRSYTGDGKSLVPAFLSESFEMLKRHRKEITGSIREQMANPLDPQKAINSFETWRDAQSELIGAVLSPWLPSGGKQAAADDPETQNDPSAETTKPAEDATGMADELSDLKKQIEAMQEKLQQIQDK